MELFQAVKNLNLGLNLGRADLLVLIWVGPIYSIANHLIDIINKLYLRLKTLFLMQKRVF